MTNTAVLSAVAPSYSPDGRALIVSSVIGQQEGYRGDVELDKAVRAHLSQLYGVDASGWEHLRTYRLPGALPAMPAPHNFRRPVRVLKGLYVCGDHRDSSSIQGAMVSGRRAAEAALADLGVPSDRRRYLRSPMSWPARVLKSSTIASRWCGASWRWKDRMYSFPRRTATAHLLQSVHSRRACVFEVALLQVRGGEHGLAEGLAAGVGLAAQVERALGEPLCLPGPAQVPVAVTELVGQLGLVEERGPGGFVRRLRSRQRALGVGRASSHARASPASPCPRASTAWKMAAARGVAMSLAPARAARASWTASRECPR